MVVKMCVETWDAIAGHHRTASLEVSLVVYMCIYYTLV